MPNSNESKKYHYIYKTTNLLNGKFYIGMHSAKILNDNYLGSGKRLRYSIRKYGIQNFKLEILEIYPNRSSLTLREKKLVNDSLLSDPMCMNLRKGGTGGFSHEQQVINSKKGHKKFFELMQDFEWKNKQREKQSTGMKFYLKKKKIKGIWEGKKHKQESKLKIGLANSILQRDNKNSQYNTRWITNGIKDKKIKNGDVIPNGWYYGRKIIKKGNGVVITVNTIILSW